MEIADRKVSNKVKMKVRPVSVRSVESVLAILGPKQRCSVRFKHSRGHIVSCVFASYSVCSLNIAK